MSGVSELYTPAPAIREVTECRLCGNEALNVWFSLGEQPLANALKQHPDDQEEKYPLAVQRCMCCGLSQLTRVVSPEILYRNYAYVSGASQSWHHHAKDLVAIVQKHYRDAKFILDIASNDGTMLSYFQKVGYRVLGVDPAENLYPAVPTERAFWVPVVAADVMARHGKADVILAQNVLGHVDDPVDFLRCVRPSLNDGGVVIIEVPNLMNLLAGNAFDTIYHEHLSYWSVTAMNRAAKKAGLEIERMDPLAIHGGSIRYWLKYSWTSTPVTSLEVHACMKLERQLGLLERGPYSKFTDRVEIVLRQLTELLETFSREGKTIGAYGAPAKGNVLLNALKANGAPLPRMLIDDALTKQGKYAPGTGIPIVAPEGLGEMDVLMILPWNVETDIKRRAKELGFKGKFLIPLPTPRIE